MAAHAGRHDLVRRQGLPGVHDPGQFLGIECKRDRAAERNARVAHPADVGVGDIEIEVEPKRSRIGNACYATFCVFWFELAVFQKSRCDLTPHQDEVEAGPLELEQARKVFVDHVDFDDTYLRQNLALHAFHKRGVRRFAAFREVNCAIARIGFENDARTALPFA